MAVLLVHEPWTTCVFPEKWFDNQRTVTDKLMSWRSSLFHAIQYFVCCTGIRNLQLIKAGINLFLTKYLPIFLTGTFLRFLQCRKNNNLQETLFSRQLKVTLFQDFPPESFGVTRVTSDDASNGGLERIDQVLEWILVSFFVYANYLSYLLSIGSHQQSWFLFQVGWRLKFENNDDWQDIFINVINARKKMERYVRCL